ncbi:MAG: 6-carboxytetrahydropterin synthase [Pseudomonadota bacterium]
MFALEVRDHIMIAHSFKGEFFGPAQAMHGATFVIDACFRSLELDAHNVVIDIGAAHDVLKDVLAPINYANLDAVKEFDGENTTTEFLTLYIWKKLAAAATAGKLGRNGEELHSIKVTLSESHVARAWYDAELHD